MAYCTVSDTRIAGISAAVPEHSQSCSESESIFGREVTAKISRHSGVSQRHVTLKGLCTSDLCYIAAERLLKELDWTAESIDALILVTQTPDYVLPATSCTLQRRLGLSKRCAAFDVNLGCSGYVYGLWLAGRIVSGGGFRRVLLLVGDTISRIVSPSDRASALLFGDAGTATALERCQDSEEMRFDLGTDGTGQDSLIVPAGSFRHPSTYETAQRKEREGGNVRSDEDLFMDGIDVFNFTIREVIPLILNLLKETGWSKEELDALVLHQANQFILQHLAKRLGLPAEKVPSALQFYGNTSSASIPLTLVSALGDRIATGAMRLLLAGFGVGWSWGAVTLSCGPARLVGPVLVPE
jgi:3-oxoacyl-[acyl-carrier-protein] synthase III